MSIELHLQTNGCSIFLSICPDFISNEYLLREYDTAADGDLSLNRCTMETAPLMPKKFQLGRDNIYEITPKWSESSEDIVVKTIE